VELLRTQAKGGINGSVNDHKFYQKTSFHNAIEDAIEEISLKAGVLLQAKFNGSNSETKIKSILGSLVLACIKSGDEIAAMNTKTFEAMLKEISKQSCMACSDYRIIIDTIFKPRDESQEERVKRRRKEEASAPYSKNIKDKTRWFVTSEPKSKITNEQFIHGEISNMIAKGARKNILCITSSLFNDQLWESSFGSRVVEKMKSLGLSEGKTVYFPFHDSNVYFVTITTKRHQNNSEESCWQIGYPQLVTDSMGAVLRQLASTNQTELVIWKPKPSIHALKNRGNEGADDWCRFENAYMQLMKPEYEKIKYQDHRERFRKKIHTEGIPN